MASSVKVFKFGGASVKSAEGVRNIAKILEGNASKLIVVISAMGKTTNALERMLSGYIAGTEAAVNEFSEIKKFHYDIANSLFNNTEHPVFQKLRFTFTGMQEFLETNKLMEYNYCYDQLVSYGEILSTLIISEFLNSVGVENDWVDVREVLRSDSNYREGNINFEESTKLCSKHLTFGENSICITQGFIAGTNDGKTTTLGREGSDYTAAILANLLDAEDVTIWKDVEGVLNADPKIFSNTVRLDTVTFKEAIELAYCGAQIIHPKTIKPLQNKKIPLLVKSFVNPDGVGTKIIEAEGRIEFPPIVILKQNQVLISLTPKDFSFVIEDCLSKIFAVLFKHRVKANLVQNSAISFSICVDNEEHFLPGAINELRNEYSVRYNKNLNLLTVRHYTKEKVDELLSGKSVFLEQKTRSTARFITSS
ncbi:MAG TPA: aspartate kinase [Tenuifilaceae bacterium]|nr:aspartate kinase [Tenuifilaceae bacterium]HPE17599.1 aspartate kinase [Tenuifilaceae bacterium]HPJ46889.1 aspartate kinase [Tenuifilaceae bacterium]HPQ33755.1 aspartate kinase [Tenuifilaceae bacterium]HRX69155.1 aspartate kinase [Tenuifilaceae bacterium]